MASDGWPRQAAMQPASRRMRRRLGAYSSMASDGRPRQAAMQPASRRMRGSRRKAGGSSRPRVAVAATVAVRKARSEGALRIPYDVESFKAILRLVQQGGGRKKEPDAMCDCSYSCSSETEILCR